MLITNNNIHINTTIWHFETVLIPFNHYIVTAPTAT